MRQVLFLVAMAVLGWSCSNKETVVDNPEGKGEATMTITLAGDRPAGRASGTPTQVEENAVNSYTVYVFRNDNTLEKIRTFISTGLTQTLDGLTEGPKIVAVVANAPAGFPAFAVGDSHTRFAEATSKINLDTQQDLANSGLTMSGEVSVTLQPSPTLNPVTVPISRVVAKIKLGTITLDPAQGLDAGLFELFYVIMMDAPSLSSVGPANTDIVTTGPLYGGRQGVYVLPENVRTYLSEDITVLAHSDKFFYVFADDATMMTLVGRYNNGPIVYFPFVIDPILRNTQHTINITLRRLGSGSPDPDVPSDPTTMDITIVPQDWILVPSQNVVW